MKIAIYGRSASPQNFKSLQQLCQLLEKHKLEVIVYKPFLDGFLQDNQKFVCHYNSFQNLKEINDVDFMFSIGGDGTLLNTVDFVYNTSIPVVGINTGRLGFLTHYTNQDFNQLLLDIQQENYAHDCRQLLQVNCNRPIFKNNVQYALNEFTVQKKDPSAVIKVNAYVNDEFLTSYWADGLIVSTSTGSTGYSLSAGGPIVLPQSNAFVITPIAPHNLTQRPLIIPDDSIVRLTISEHRGESYCTVDSKYWPIEENFEFVLKKSNFVVNILHPKSLTFTDTLRNKLMWGMDNRNK